MSSTQDSPLVQRKGSATDASLVAQGQSEGAPKEVTSEPVPGKKRKGKEEKVSKKTKSPQATDAVRLAKNLHQGAIVYEDGQYKGGQITVLVHGIVVVMCMFVTYNAKTLSGHGICS